MAAATVLTVTGMHSPQCVRRLTSCLEAIRGVVDVHVTLDSGETWVAYDPAHTGPERFLVAARAMGFDARVSADPLTAPSASIPGGRRRARDVVCGAWVSPHHFEVVFGGLAYSFCSEHCTARFTANPHRYIGRPAAHAPPHERRAALKRRLALPAPLSEREAAALITVLRRAPGVSGARLDGPIAEITYGPQEAAAEERARWIFAAAAELGPGWSEWLQQAFRRRNENSGIGSAKIPARSTHTPTDPGDRSNS